jgi:hypothetical protein
MDSYNNSQVRIWSVGRASRPINNRRGVKQGSPLSSLLFNICVDPLISFLKKSEGLGYRTSELGETIIQAYADDKILVSDSEQNLQTLINRAKSFFDFENLDLIQVSVKFSELIQTVMIIILPSMV